ncbi:MAG: 1-acyl-sn-glycerol-3-phosphate acyltransferase, partial [Firmicutes bacterium]|nr:1-acyl-sn-glycerol-3-phosphate acyltransferase [Bacillota bacterium]
FLGSCAALATTAWTLARLPFCANPESSLAPWSRRVLKHLRIEVDVEGPMPEGGQLWVSNHLSWLDPLVLLSLRSSRLLAKREVAEYPWIGFGARRAGVHFVDRRDAGSRADALWAMRAELAQGHPFLLFPEGTTTCGEGLARLYEGGLRLAYRMDIPVLPLRLHCAQATYPWVGGDDLLSHLSALRRGPSLKVRVRPGTVLWPRHFPSEQAWVDRLRADLHPASLQECA